MSIPMNAEKYTIEMEAKNETTLEMECPNRCGTQFRGLKEQKIHIEDCQSINCYCEFCGHQGDDQDHESHLLKYHLDDIS